METAHMASLFQCSHPARALRGGQVDGFAHFHRANVATLLPKGEDLEVKGIKHERIVRACVR